MLKDCKSVKGLQEFQGIVRVLRDCKGCQGIGRQGCQEIATQECQGMARQWCQRMARQEKAIEGKGRHILYT